MKRTVLQSIRDVLLDSGWEIFDICIRNPGIFKPADIETELFHHRLEAGNPQLHVRVFKVDLIDAVIADKEIRN